MPIVLGCLHACKPLNLKPNHELTLFLQTNGPSIREGLVKGFAIDSKNERIFGATEATPLDIVIYDAADSKKQRYYEVEINGIRGYITVVLADVNRLESFFAPYPGAKIYSLDLFRKRKLNGK